MKKKQDAYFFKLLAIAVLFCVLSGFLTFCQKEEPASVIEPEVTTEPIEPPTTVPPPTVPASVFEKTLEERMIEAAAQYYGVSPDFYPEDMYKLLKRHKEAQKYVLSYPEEKDKEHPIDMSEFKDVEGVPLFIQWDERWGYIKYGKNIAGLNGCGPVSLSMVAYYYTRDEAMRPDKILDFSYKSGYCVPGHGTAWTLISEGAVKLGFKVKKLSNVKSQVIEELEAGHPIIFNAGAGDFTSSSHYLVMVGVEDGMIRINDSNSRRNSEKLWDFDQFKSQIRAMWAISYEPPQETVPQESNQP